MEDLYKKWKTFREGAKDFSQHTIGTKEALEMMDPMKEAAVWARVRAASGGGDCLEKKTVLREKTVQKGPIPHSGWKLWGGLPVIVAALLLMKRR